MAGRGPAWILALASLGGGSVEADSDLSVSQAIEPTPMELGASAVITLEVANLGADTATDVAVVQTVPGGATVLSASDGGLVAGDGLSVSWNIPSLAGGETRTFEVEIEAGLNTDSATTRVIMAARDAVSDDGGLFIVDPAAETADNLVLFESAGELTDAAGAGPSYATDMGQEGLIDLGEPVIDGQVFDDLGDPISSGELLVNPAGVALLAGQLYVADRDGIRFDEALEVTEDMSGRIIRITPGSGAQEIVAEGDQLSAPQAITVDPEGQLLVADAIGRILSVDPVSGAQTLLTSGGQIADPVGLELALDGTIYLLDRTHGLVRIDPDDFTQTVVAAIGSVAEFATPGGLSISLTGRLFVSVNAAPGYLLEFDPVSESFVGTTSGIANDFARPAGSVTSDEVLTEASVDFAGIDPELENNLFPLATQVVLPPAGLPTVMISVTEQISVTDLPAVTPQIVIQVSETITTSDTTNVAPVVLIRVQESVAVTDADSVAPATFITVRELVSLTEGVAAVPPEKPPTIPGLLPTERFCEGEAFVLSDTPVTRMEVSFDMAMAVGEGAGAADKPGSYRIASGGRCDGDADALVDTATWDAERQVATLALNGGAPLPAGDYEFLACDALEAEAGARLDGDGDGTAGGDYRRAFRVVGDNLLENPNFDVDQAGWESPGNLGDGDALGLHRSRSLGLAEGESLSQCVNLEGDHAFLRTSLSTRSEGANRFEVRFDFAAGENCDGEVTPAPTTLLSPGGAAWRRVFTDAPVPAGTRSVRLVLTPDGPARFDAVSLYGAETAFGSGFEGAECGLNFSPGTELPDGNLTGE